MQVRFLLAIVLFAGAGNACAAADYLKVGDPAPVLHPTVWIKGDPVARYEKGRVYVVDFWATWCLPCVAAMPHLTELQASHRRELTVVSVNVLEAAMGHGDEASVRAFVAKGDPAMDFTVAMDDPFKQPMFNQWMVAAGLCCLPNIVIVDGNGKIAWMGNTGEDKAYPFDDALKDVLSGKVDAARAHALQEKTRAGAARILAMKPALDARMRHDFPTQLAAINQALTQHPEYAAIAFPLKLGAMVHIDETGAWAFVDETSKNPNLRAQLETIDNSTYWALVAQTITAEPGLSSSAYAKAQEYSRRAKAK
ncbi:MAG TPA: TlpA disulfide reductase family protein [Rhizomicrobium sp.]|nr:TlpA disulfide reductase family protein [Rhizomicrobium sp.]